MRQYRKLGKPDMDISIICFGVSPLCGVFEKGIKILIGQMTMMSNMLNLT